MKILLIVLIVGGLIYGGYRLVQNNTVKDTAHFVYDTQALDTKAAITPDLAVLRAKEVYQLAVNSGDDLSQGPCLSNSLISGWVLDIVHSPRTAVDDKPENQCSAYREGAAKHFVELDTEGNFVRAE
ncbi:MAG: hypothetical protein COT25_02765 [Candidatus Kerfeldbacteria bacterium CG08_land_8_20_14_0_20_42_7]|uniref:Uncharacterized protein n=1 Tax=Candidatus Kerfeldbacteria bacterium CG08_land_8_20_14_0_20_42_7 TaxID=2014245 RepID=A0A2H0YSM8_9BACT|nr:MAG: hypothetical protein COT25_02765 [Candidatus Kerfeldbacteria bacterium CG08_land_8_20_14_0_20_42_7]